MIIDKNSDFIELQKNYGQHIYVCKDEFSVYDDIIIDLDYPIHFTYGIYVNGKIESNVCIISKLDIVATCGIKTCCNVIAEDCIKTYAGDIVAGDIRAHYVEAGGDIDVLVGGLWVRDGIVAGNIEVTGDIGVGGNIKVGGYIKAAGKIFWKN